jgi:DNA-directed RNA polymerase specialized sigma24 family protein
MDVDRSFAAFVSARWSMLYRLSVLLAGPAAADDVAQTALARAYASWREVEESASADDHVKALLARTAASLGPPDGDAESATTARGRLAVLPARQRTAVVLRAYELLSDAEIARAIGGKADAAGAEAVQGLSALAMSDDELADLLAGLAAETDVPLPPLEAVVARGRAERRSRRVRTLRWSGGVAAVVVLALAAASVMQAISSDGPGTKPASSARPAPATLADLPGGGPVVDAYVEAQTLYVGSAFTIRFSELPTSLRQAGAWIYVGLESGRIVRVDRASLAARQIANDSGGFVTTDATGRLVAWLASGVGDASVVLESAPVGNGPGRRTRSFPARPKCCDNPFLLDGVTVSGEVIASMPAEGRTWVWRSGAPAGSAEALQEIGGIGNGVVRQVLGDEIVVLYPPVHFAVGVLEGAAFLVEEDVVATNADFGDPTGEHVVYSDSAGRIVVRERRGGDSPDERTLRLPALEQGFDALRWEDDDHVLLDLTDGSVPEGALVRCDVTSGDCELVRRFDGPHLVAR